MPAQHKPRFISTAEWNQFGERVRSRQNGGPRDPHLSALIVQALLLRFRRSARQEDQHLLYLIEQLALWEDRIVVSGCDVQKELHRDHSIFDPLFRDLIYAEPDKKCPDHDTSIVRIQYDLLWTFVRDHPLPSTAHNPIVLTERRHAWLTTRWTRLDHLLRQCPCHCQYRSPDEPPPELPIKFTPKQLFLTLLAHFHHSTPDTIAQFLKPSARRR